MMLKNKVAVVTGANRGIGLAIAQTFVDQGAKVIACMRDLDPQVLRLIDPDAQSDRVLGVRLDLQDEASIKSAVREVAALTANRLDVLVNNAGTASGGLFQMMTMAEMRRVLEVNLLGPILLTQGLARLMTRQRSGSIIHIGSSAAYFADPGTLAYGVSKAGLARAAGSMASELGAFNVRVNCIAPGVTRTEMLAQMDPKASAGLIDRAAFKRAAEPQEVANVALFLASDLSGFVTGQTLRVDGGLI